MKTQTIYLRILQLTVFVVFVLGLHSCVSPTDVDGGNIIVDPPPYAPVALVKPKEVELVLINESTLIPNGNTIRPLWDNDLQHKILIDTNKPTYVDSLGVTRSKRLLPRVYLEFTATVKLDGANPREKNGFMLRKISLSIPDTIDLEIDEEVTYVKNELLPQRNFFEYTYKTQQNVKAYVIENTGKISLKAVKLEQRNRIFVEFTYDVLPAVNGTNIPSERLHGSGRLIINY